MIVKAFGAVKLSVCLVGNRFSVSFPGFDIADCKALIDNNGQRRFLDFKAIDTDEKNILAIKTACALGEGQIRFSGHKNSRGVAGLEIGMTFAPISSSDGLALAPLFVPALAADHVLQHGRKMGGCRLLALPVRSEKDVLDSAFLTALTKNGQTLRLSHPLAQKHQAFLRAHIEHDIVRDLIAETKIGPATAGETAAAIPVKLIVSADGHGLLEDYGDTEKDPKRPVKRVKTGWNSWDYYRWTITEQEVLKNAEFIRNDPVLSKHVKRITVDDGWQYCYGEWDANSFFPSGMESLAKKLTAMGFEPGLWLAPTIFEPHSRVAQIETDMLAKGLSGAPCLAFQCMRRYGFVLDPTLEKSKKWLYALFDRYAGMGFKFFKIDFIASTLLAPVFADKTVGRGEITREILKPIREATKGRAELLGCNYNFEGGTDLVDGVRTSADIHVTWDCIRHNSHSIAARYWCQDRLWDNDPDFAICRGPDTSDDPLNDRMKPCAVFVTPEMTDAASRMASLTTGSYEEAKTLLSLAIVSGGGLNLSDCLYKLNARGLDLARKTVAAERGDAGKPLDLFSSELAALWTQKIDDGHRVLLINWQDAPKTLSLDLNSAGVTGRRATDFWTGEPIAVSGDELNATLPPRACAFVVLRTPR